MDQRSSLDLQTCRYLKTRGFSNHLLKEIAYLTVTYAIERRAEELYPLYDEALRCSGSKVAVKSILLEEKKHLSNMRKSIEGLPSGAIHASQACAFESGLCKQWLESLSKELSMLI